MKHSAANACPGVTCTEPACVAMREAKAAWTRDEKRIEAAMTRFDGDEEMAK